MRLDGVWVAAANWVAAGRTSGAIPGRVIRVAVRITIVWVLVDAVAGDAMRGQVSRRVSDGVAAGPVGEAFA
jgi:hypothetical protein